MDTIIAYEVPYDLFYELCSLFRPDVNIILMQIRVRHSRRVDEMSVGIAEEQKDRVHDLVRLTR